MFYPFSKKDGVLDSEEFKKQEATYNFLHQICEDPHAAMLMSSDKRVIAACADGYPLWICTLHPDDKKEIGREAKELCKAMADLRIPMVVAQPEMAEAFAVERCKMCGGRYYVTLRLNAYELRSIRHPERKDGAVVRAEEADLAAVKKYLSDFMFWAMGAPIDEDSMEEKAKELIGGGGLYFFCNGGEPLSWANVSFHAPRHAKINYVYTPPEYRGNGYASFLTSTLCGIALNRGVYPMLYADVGNPTSNQIYRDIGFIQCGRVDEITFD